VISHGDQTQMENAKKTITMAIVGLLIIIVSYAIVRNVINVIRDTGVTASPTSTSGSPAGTTTPTAAGQENETPSSVVSPDKGTPNAPANEGASAAGKPGDKDNPTL
jgi:hypothetical protein